MFKRLFAGTLLFILISVSFPLHAQRKVGTVEFSLCNAGKVDVDVFLSSSGKVLSAHVGAADCKSVAKTMGSMEPGYVGLAFSDSHGQWGAAQRLDLLPDWGSLPDRNVIGAALGALGARGASPRPAAEPQRVLSRANQTASVQHGNVTVSLPMPLLFRPLSPTCRSVGGESTAAQENLPFNATATQRAIAVNTDIANSTPGETVCDNLLYALNVEAFADTHEITFKQECDPCDKKAEAQLTPEQRAARQRQADAANQAVAAATRLGPLGAVFGNIVGQGYQEAEREAKERAARVKPPQPVNWGDLLSAMKVTPASGGLPPEIPRNIMVRGTVSRIEEAPANATEHWVDIYMKESPDGMFDLCALGPDIFQDAFGANFRTAMIGKPVEVEGQLQRASCKGSKGSIRVTLAHQARVVASALFDPAVVPRIVHPIDQSADPNKIPVMTTISRDQLIHVTLLEPVVAPNRPPGIAMAEGKTTVHARLENPLLSTGRDVPGTAVMFPAGSDLSVTVFLSSADPQGNKNSILNLQVMSARVAGLNGEQQLISANVGHHFAGWPAAGQVLIPAKTPLSFLLGCGCIRSVSKADFLASAAAVASSANRPVASYGSRPILMNSRMSITALEAIDVASVGTNNVFRAELKADLDPPNGLPEVGAIRLPHGTEVYLRAMPRDLDPATFGHVAEVSVDHVVLNGQNVPVVTTQQYVSYNVPTVNPNTRIQPAAQRPLVAAGMVLTLTVLDQQDVPDSGPAILMGSRPTGIAPAPTAAPTSAAQPPAQPTPAVPPRGTAAQTPADRQQQLNDRKQEALRVLNCRQQAIKDHPKGGPELTQAMRDCAQAK